MPRGLRPVRKGRVVQVVRTSPDIKEDQRPEVNDRQAIGINRTFGTFRNEIVHHPKEAGRQEEAHRVMAIPPLCQRILHTREQRVGFGPHEGNRNRQVVAQMQHCDRHDEGQIEPVRDIDMRLMTLQQGSDEHRQIRNPHHGDPDINKPFRFGIFATLGNPHHIAECGHDDEQLIAPENECRKRLAAIKRRAAGPLHDIDRRCQKSVTAKGKNHRRSMQRPQATEIQKFIIEIKRRKCELPGDEIARQKSDDAPKYGRQCAPAHNVHIIINSNWR